MRVKVIMTRKDRITGIREILAETTALYDGESLRYREEDGGAMQKVTFRDGFVILERKAEVSSRTEFSPDGQGKCIVMSAYGNMELQAYMDKADRSPQLWQVGYKVFSGDEVVTDQLITWQIISLN